MIVYFQFRIVYFQSWSYTSRATRKFHFFVWIESEVFENFEISKLKLHNYGIYENIYVISDKTTWLTKINNLDVLKIMICFWIVLDWSERTSDNIP